MLELLAASAERMGLALVDISRDNLSTPSDNAVLLGALGLSASGFVPTRMFAVVRA